MISDYHVDEIGVVKNKNETILWISTKEKPDRKLPILITSTLPAQELTDLLACNNDIVAVRKQHENMTLDKLYDIVEYIWSYHLAKNIVDIIFHIGSISLNLIMIQLECASYLWDNNVPNSEHMNTLAKQLSSFIGTSGKYAISDNLLPVCGYSTDNCIVVGFIDDIGKVIPIHTYPKIYSTKIGLYKIVDTDLMATSNEE